MQADGKRIVDAIQGEAPAGPEPGWAGRRGPASG